MFGLFFTFWKSPFPGALKLFSRKQMRGRSRTVMYEEHRNEHLWTCWETELCFYKPSLGALFINLPQVLQSVGVPLLQKHVTAPLPPSTV